MQPTQKLLLISFLITFGVFECTEIIGAILWPEQKLTAVITCVDALFIAIFAWAISRNDGEGEEPRSCLDRVCVWFYVWMIWSAGVILPNIISIVLLTEHTIRSLSYSTMMIVMAVVPFCVAMLAILVSVIICSCETREGTPPTAVQANTTATV